MGGIWRQNDLERTATWGTKATFPRVSQELIRLWNILQMFFQNIRSEVSYYSNCSGLKLDYDSDDFLLECQTYFNGDPGDG